MEADKLNKLGHDYFLADVTLNSLRPRQESTPGCMLGRKWSLHDPRVILGCPKPSWAAWVGLRGSRPAPSPEGLDAMTDEDQLRGRFAGPSACGSQGPPGRAAFWHVLLVGCWLKTPCPSPPVHFGSWGFSRCDDSLLSRDSKSRDLSIHSRNSSWKLLEASHCCKCWDPAWATGASAHDSCHWSGRGLLFSFHMEISMWPSPCARPGVSTL